MPGWGIDGWGISPWGLGTVAGVPGATAVSPGVLDVLGGTIITIIGSNFADPVTIDVLSGAGAPYAIEGNAYLFDPEFDLTATRLIAGAPALPAGTYHLRVNTTAGPGTVLLNALVYAPFAEEVKVHRHRAKWANVWAVGLKYLR